MKETGMKLTYVDRMILESYKSMMDGLAKYFGNGYEFVLHTLENYDCSVVKIINGSYTGRKEGAPITSLALSMLEEIREQEGLGGSVSYYTRNRQNRPLKSCTIAVVGENERIIGLLCINFFLDTPFTQVLESFVQQKMIHNVPHRDEEFAESIDDLLLNTVEEVRAKIYGDSNIPSSNKNKEIIRLLDEKGIFKMKDAVGKIADLLNISKNTVYLHLRNNK